jgi:hypothetical protein
MSVSTLMYLLLFMSATLVLGLSAACIRQQGNRARHLRLVLEHPESIRGVWVESDRGDDCLRMFAELLDRTRVGIADDCEIDHARLQLTRAGIAVRLSSPDS